MENNLANTEIYEITVGTSERPPKWTVGKPLTLNGNVDTTVSRIVLDTNSIHLNNEAFINVYLKHKDTELLFRAYPMGVCNITFDVVSIFTSKQV